MASFVPPPTRGINPLGFLVPAFQGLFQGQELGRERQDLQHLGNIQQLANLSGQAPDFSGFQSQQFRGQAAQNMFQNLGIANQPISPFQQQGLDIQREGIQQRRDAAEAAARRATEGTPFTIKFFDAQGQEQGVRVNNATANATREAIRSSGGTISDPLERANAQSVLTARIADQRRAKTKSERDIADRERSIAQGQVDEFRKVQEEFRKQRADLRAEDIAEIPKGQMIGDEWHEWRIGDDGQARLTPTGLKAPPRLQLTDVGEQKGIFDPATGEIKTTEFPSAKVPSTQINIKQPPAKMLEDLGILYDMQDQVVDLAGLFDEGETFWAGKFENFKARYGIAGLPVIGDIVSSPKERGIMFRQIADTLKEDLARKRSGGQITASEFVRLDRLLPDWKSPPKTFMAKLKGFAKSLDRTVASKRRVLRETGFIVPGETRVQGPRSVSAGRQRPIPSKTQMLNAINAATRELPGATPQEIANRAKQILNK